ncbi:factor-independent urate hydroxylase [Cryptosporangium sp. NPDC051539]|uniref:factor-independent urate hydroxylase n=1 Tax=Cryptosporangium sp. NPDC051539 TaxID=3363962 RepID=UPI0037A45DFF
MTFSLGPNQYGKAGVRLVTVDGGVVTDLTIASALSGDLEATHYTGDNSAVLATDTQKNTMYAFAREFGVGSPEEFGLRLGRHFVTSQKAISTARLTVEQHRWERIPVDGEPAPHSFVRSGTETRRARVVVSEDSAAVSSGLGGLTVMNTTDSEFHGFPRDRYTTLPETSDRILATSVDAWWDHTGTDLDWEAVYDQARGALLTAFASTYSYSLQQTLLSMGSLLLSACPSVGEVRLSLPNKHHNLVDLSPFGLDNPNRVYVAPTEPFGLIQGTVRRDGATYSEGPALW